MTLRAMTGSVPLVLGRVSIDEIRATPDCRSWGGNSSPLREGGELFIQRCWLNPLSNPLWLAGQHF